jgi:hypothetical protein
MSDARFHEHDVGHRGDPVDPFDVQRRLRVPLEPTRLHARHLLHRELEAAVTGRDAVTGVWQAVLLGEGVEVGGDVRVVEGVNDGHGLAPAVAAQRQVVLDLVGPVAADRRGTRRG